MAEVTLEPHDPLSKRADETPQQHADRMLSASRRGLAAAASASPVDLVEQAQRVAEQAHAITIAVLDCLQNMRVLISPSGVSADSNLLLHVKQAQQLLGIGDDLSDRAIALLRGSAQKLYSLRRSA